MKRDLKRRLVLLLCLALVILLLGTVCFLAWRQDITYRLQTNIQAVFAPSLSLENTDAETMQVSLSELQNDPRVTFEQSMLLINEEYPLDEDFSAEIGAYRDTDVLINLCAHDAYETLAAKIDEMFDEKLLIRSAYRTAEEQREEELANSDKAASVGASEHQAGLALDVYIPYYAGDAFLKTAVGRYVNSHCYEYGFIIRYPSYGKDSTGISYEPWHLRYVGLPHASIMTEHCLTLEEYMQSLAGGKLYVYDSYIITRQSGDSFVVPKSFRSAKISPDHTGGYILTFYI